ncbi:hypothetical protein [Actinomadura chibensis]|uniref:Uncharacterized protein n=1 Tax=Actinomadura chibensis TaxID=392828 RepID=A0A5D0NM60_9ACTN|nr:hypothetical protein [Actinomadura chibensis]TYB45495.1 hypothetical protein FXF69_18865 [Actinomadura chibensis]
MTTTALRHGTPYRGTARALSFRHRFLLIATIVMLGGSLAVLQGTRQSFGEARSRTAPAVLEIAQARKALAEADSAAVASFQAAESELTGFRPGEEYQNQIGIANQSLAQAAEDNSVGAFGSRVLQTVEGSLVAYTGWIGQAGAQFRQGDTALGTASLWYASVLMNAEGSGILYQLEKLQGAELDNLKDKLTLDWIDLAAMAGWAGPVALVLVLLSTTQVFMARRFRRTVNWHLLAATLLVLAGLGMGGALIRADRDHLAAGKDALIEATDIRDGQVEQAHYTEREAFGKLLQRECAGDAQGCGPTVAAFLAKAGSRRVTERPTSERTAIEAGKSAAGQTDAARLSPYYAFPAVIVPLAVFVLILWGFRARIDEYRYLPR